MKSNHLLSHAPSLLYLESYHDGNWRNHIRGSFRVTSTSSKDFFYRESDERIGFGSCWRWKRLPTNPTNDQKSNCWNRETGLWTTTWFVHKVRGHRHWLQGVWIATCSCETRWKLALYQYQRWHSSSSSSSTSWWQWNEHWWSSFMKDCQWPLRSWNERHQRTGRPVLDAHSSRNSE